MMSKKRNIILFAIIALIIILGFVFFVDKKLKDKEKNLTSSSNAVAPESAQKENNNETKDTALAQNSLSLLLSIQSIKLDDTIFSDPVFYSLRDSSIVLKSDGKAGRPNPFAPIGSEFITPTIDENNLENIGENPE